MNVLVINAGSSSLKYQLINMIDESVLAGGVVERIGIGGSFLKHKPSNMDGIKLEKEINDHNDAIALVLESLMSKEYGVISSVEEINAIGHRVVHGGEKFSDSVLINDEVMDAIEENIELAPLHNPANIMGIMACRQAIPNTPMVAVFDTAFYQTMPQKAYLYGLPYEVYTKYKVRRYGFHGTSHKYIALRTAKLMGENIKDLKIVTCHLGNGGSIAATKYGQPIDTSMGFTPLEGLVMGTRSGDIDPAIVDYLMKKLDMNTKEINNYLNKQSGVLGISGRSSDFRDLWDYAEAGDKRSILAIEVYCYRVKKYIGAYIAAMGGVDAVIFSAGVGENDIMVREMIMDGFEYLGVHIDTDLNDEKGVEKVISTEESKVLVMVVPTNEELMIARDTNRICI